MSKLEIEIKSLLGSKENADLLKSKIIAQGAVLIDKNKQLNHYFVINDLELFKKNFSSKIHPENFEAFNKILSDGKKISLRTREVGSKVIFVLKAAIDADSSSNSVSRIEFEQVVDMTLDEVDALLLESGLSYQAKWSREREEYELEDLHVCIDKNAGYGYLAEFETMTDNAEKVPEIKNKLIAKMAEFGVEELPQDRLERMFDFYNKNWAEYYGTEKVFNIN